MGARRLAGGLALVVLAALTLLPGVSVGSAVSAPDAPERRSAAVLAAAAPVKDSYRATKTIGRVIVGADGVEQPVSSYDMTVTANGLTDLRGRERVEVSWTGAPPSGGRSNDPYGPKGLAQEYPVVVMQCRGLDDPKLPPRKRLSRETCWTSAVTQRSVLIASGANATWTVDHYADPADRELISGMEPFPSEECPNVEHPELGWATHITPFRAANGTVYPFCNADEIAPEAAVDSAMPPAEMAAFSDENGRGEVQFEVRSAVENESLGCSYKVACSIVVVPIVGISCAQPQQPMTEVDKGCRKYGQFPPGSSNFAGLGVDQAVSPELWWSESNWRNRFSIPIDFGLPPDACEVLDQRPPTGFYGSELMAQAALQWAPAYCLNEKRFKFQLNQMPDQTGWNLMETGGGPAAFVAAEHKRTGSDPVGYAPTAVTGFSVGYVIDRPDNAGEFTDLRLNARLIAKLITQSYLGSDLGRGHPGIGDNPLAIMNDPEFIKLNPGLSQISQEAGANLISLANSADVIRQLTTYVASDKEAMAFINGKPDPWGMKVNPAYKRIELPRDEWPLLDEYVPETEQECRKANPAVYFNLLAAPVTTMRKIADALIDAWPYTATRCERDLSVDPDSPPVFKIGRVDRQSFGARFLLGLASSGDAERYGLHEAALETSNGTYVEPSEESFAAAVRVAQQVGEKGDEYGPYVVDAGRAARAGNAYPGTMIVSTVARLQNLEQEQADDVASFIRIATTEGQRPGRGNGFLPAGYLPIRKTGVTAKLWRQAQRTADAIEAQAGPDDPDDGSPDQDDTPTTPVDPETGDPEDDGTPDEDDPVDPDQAEAAPTTPTSAESSNMGKSLLPVLMIIGLLAAASSVVSRFVGSGGP